jgi:hypothetical protein
VKWPSVSGKISGGNTLFRAHSERYTTPVSAHPQGWNTEKKTKRKRHFRPKEYRCDIPLPTVRVCNTPVQIQRATFIVDGITYEFERLH